MEELEERRYLHASRTFEGMVKVDGLFDPVTGDLILTAFDAAMAPPGGDDLRSGRQRRADAFAHLARSFLDSGQASGTEKPHVVVVTDLDALQGHGGGTHETMNGHVLTPEQVRHYACDCTISRIVFGPGSEPIDIGRATRTVPAAMRRALNVRDRHCQHPSGCDRPARVVRSTLFAPSKENQQQTGARSVDSSSQAALGRRRTHRPRQPHTPLPIPPHPRTPNRPTAAAPRGEIRWLSGTGQCCQWTCFPPWPSPRA